MPAVSVVIPAFNEERLLKRCLSSLSDQTFPRTDYEIIVIDNNSTDRTPEIAGRYADQLIHLSRKGVLFARQEGFCRARGEIILRTDADAIVPRDWVEKGFQEMKNNLELVALGGYYYPDKKYWLASLFSSFRIGWLDSCYRRRGTINWLSGSCSGFRKKAFLKAGGFNLESDPYCGDQQEIAFRMNKIGRVGFARNWWVRTSLRRLEKRSWRDLIKDYLFYQVYSSSYFCLFRKCPRRFFVGSWEDIRLGETVKISNA